MLAMLKRCQGKENTMKQKNVDKEIVEAAIRFLDRFEDVFHYDWENTKHAIGEKELIREYGTFCHPDIKDIHNNWSGRGALLERYQEFAKLVRERDTGIEHQ